MQSSSNVAGNAATFECATGRPARRTQSGVACCDIPEPGDLALPCESVLQMLAGRVTAVTNAPHGRAGACHAAPRQAVIGRGRAADHCPHRLRRDRMRPFRAHASAADRHRVRFRPPARDLPEISARPSRPAGKLGSASEASTSAWNPASSRPCLRCMSRSAWRLQAASDDRRSIPV